MVPAAMVELATRRRSVGDWRGACAAAMVDPDVDLAAVRRSHGAAVATKVHDDLRHLAPDLLRWHLPRRRTDGLLREGLWFPLALFGNAHALVAHTPALGGPQRIALRFEQVDGSLLGRRDDTLLFVPDRWDTRRTGELLARCGGVTRLPCCTPAGVPGDPESAVEAAVRLDEEGRHADAWRAAGYDLEVMLFDPGWSRARIDPAAFTGGDTARARRAVVEQALSWLRPLHAALPAAAHRVLAQAVEAGRRGTRSAPAQPGHTGMVRIDLRGRHLVLDRLASARPRVRLVPEAGDGAVAAWGLPLAQIPRMPHVLARRPAELTALMRGETRAEELHPLVHLALFAQSPAPAPSQHGPLRDTVRVRCGQASHEVTMRGGTTVIPHSAVEVTRERMLQALGGRLQGCFAAHAGWRDPAVRMPAPFRALRKELFALCVYGDSQALLSALRHGLDPHVRDEQHRTLLHMLPWLPDHDLLAPLLAAGADLEARDHHGRTPLHSAVEHGTAELVRALLAAGADPQARCTFPFPYKASETHREDLAFLRTL